MSLELSYFGTGFWLGFMACLVVECFLRKPREKNSPK